MSSHMAEIPVASSNATTARARRLRPMALILTVPLLLTAMLVGQAKYTQLDLFSLASVSYVEPSAADVKAKKARPAQFPGWLAALNGKPVSIRGYMMPYDSSATTVSEFMLVSTSPANGCCFAPPTGLTGWVLVKMKPKAVAYTSTDEIGIYGTLSVSEEFDEAGFVSSVFRIVADRVDSEPAPRK